MSGARHPKTTVVYVFAGLCFVNDAFTCRHLQTATRRFRTRFFGSGIRELGCEVVTVGYDLDDLPDDIEHVRPSVVVVDAGPHLEVGRAVVKRAKQLPTLADIPILLCIEVSRLAGLDPELGMDDFILSPIVGPELYARVRQLDWRLSSFSAAGRIKLGDLVIDTVAVEATFRGAC
jgi:DNA-binding response OmpR family regulator